MPTRPFQVAPKGGWPFARAPHGKLLGLDLSGVSDDDLIPPSGHGCVYGLGAHPTDYDARRDPLVLVHGILGRSAELQAIADRTAGTGWQLHVLAYRDFDRFTRKNGDDLADELRLLGSLGDGKRTLRIVAHSLGGLVTRRALSRMAASIGLERFARVRVVAVDNPWQGFGVGNSFLDGSAARAVSGMLPGGIADMQVQSTMFKGDAKSPDPVDKVGIYGVELPDKVELQLVFAQGKSPSKNWTTPDMAPLLTSIANHFLRDTSVSGTPEQMNFWRAITDSAQYGAFSSGLRDAGEARKLTPDMVRAAFDRYYPRFAGDHTGCLGEQPAGAASLPAQIVSLLK